MENVRDINVSFVSLEIDQNKNLGMIIEKEQTRRYGGVAQLGEHLPCKQGVMGSIPIISTTGRRWEESTQENGL